MELRQLRYFAAVARHGHVGRAAQALHVAQPALSRQIQKLEEELGTVLFTRHSRGVTATAEAGLLLGRVERVLDGISAISEEFRQRALRPTGEVTIRLSPGAAELIAGPVAIAAASALPNVHLRFVTLPASILARTEAVDKTSYDLTIMNVPDGPQVSRHITLVRESVCLICRSDDVRFSGPSVTLSQLHGVPLVMVGVCQRGVRGIVDAAMRHIGFSLISIAEVDTVNASKRLVLGGLAPSVHVAAMARSEIVSGQLRAIPIFGLRSRRVLAVPEVPVPSPAIAGIIDLLLQCVSELVASGAWPGAMPTAGGDAALTDRHAEGVLASTSELMLRSSIA